MSHDSPNLDDLILLNREIAALVKAGIPLELGLRGLSGSVGTRLGRLSERLSKRLAAGQSLPDALAEEGPAVSPVYSAVMEAGLASGSLPEALESLAVSGQVLQETRRRVFLAILYPAICIVVGYLIFCIFISSVAPRILESVEMYRCPVNWPIQVVQTLNRNSGYVTTVFPVCLLALVVVTVLLRHSVTGGLYRWMSSFCWVPGVASIRRTLNWAQFTELLALQIEQTSPLARAFVLAADSTDDVRWHREAREVSEQLTRGAKLADALRSARSLPSMMEWMLATGEKQGTLALTLRQLEQCAMQINSFDQQRFLVWLQPSSQLRPASADMIDRQVARDARYPSLAIAADLRPMLICASQ